MQYMLIKISPLQRRMYITVYSKNFNIHDPQSISRRNNIKLSPITDLGKEDTKLISLGQFI
jgi:hypothetical protein